VGVLATLGAMAANGVPPAVYAQLLGFGAAGGLVGYQLSNAINPTSLPQAVAGAFTSVPIDHICCCPHPTHTQHISLFTGFHSLVGLAATFAAVGDFMTHDLATLDAFHQASTYLGAWMGSITATGACQHSPFNVSHTDRYHTQAL
jgi:NAD(P) transhydrogenase